MGISIYCQSWVGTLLVLIFVIGQERRKEAAAGIEERWNPTEELVKCVKGGAPWMFKVNASCFGLLTSYHRTIDWETVIRCAIQYREPRIFDYLIYSSQSNSLLHKCFVEHLPVWFKLVVQSGDPELAKLFFDVFGLFPEVRTIPASFSLPPGQTLADAGTLVIIKKQAIRSHTNFRVENYSSALRSCPLGAVAGSSLPLRLEDVELMIKEAEYFQSRHRFKVDKMEVYFQTSEETALAALFSIVNYLLQKDSETLQNLAEKYLQILELYLKLPLYISEEIQVSEILEYLRFSRSSRAWKTEAGLSVLKRIQLWFGNRGNLQFRCKQAILKSWKKMDSFEKNSEIPEIIREYVMLNTSTDNLV